MILGTDDFEDRAKRQEFRLPFLSADPLPPSGTILEWQSGPFRSPGDSYIYTLNSENGAGMINVSFAHCLDSVVYAIVAEIAEVAATLGIRRKSVRIIEANEMVPTTTPDQIIVGGKMENGLTISLFPQSIPEKTDPVDRRRTYLIVHSRF